MALTALAAALVFASPVLAAPDTQPATIDRTSAEGTTANALHDGSPGDPSPANLFTPAINFAQKRCVQVRGAGIAMEHGWATGLIVSPDGLILTAEGIYLAEPARLRVTLPDGRTLIPQLVRRSEPLQAALLKIDAATPDYFDLPEQPPALKGDWVVALGNAFNVAAGGEPLSASLGIVSLRTQIDAKRRTQDVPYDAPMLLIDAITSNPGEPGGALVTVDGKLAGMIGRIIESKSTNTRLNYAVPSDLLRLFLADKPIGHLAGASPEATTTTPAAAGSGKPFTGIRLFTLSGKRAPGYLDGVVAGSPAAKAGLQKDDLLLMVGSEFVRSIRECEDTLGKLRPGQEVLLRFKRKNEILQATITVGEDK